MAYDNKGSVKFYSPEKLFGFVHLDEGTDCFFHISACPKGSFPKKDERVRCEVDLEHARGPRIVKMMID